jgi:hypothetical protein
MTVPVPGPGPTAEQLEAATVALAELRAELDRVRLTLVGIGDAIEGVADTLVRADYPDDPDGLDTVPSTWD